MVATAQNATPLLGFVVKDATDEIEVRVAGGTWIIQRADIESIDDWDDPVDAGITGRPVAVIIRTGATLGFLQSITVSQSDRPLTLPPVLAAFAGQDRLQQLGESWGLQYEMHTIAADAGTTPSACDVTAEGSWGMTIQIDDCKD